MIKAYNLLGLMQRAGKLITGEDLITKNLKNNKIKLLVIAEDCGINTKKKLTDKANFYNVKCIEFSTIDNISIAIGRDNRVAVGITDDGFIKKIQTIIRRRRKTVMKKVRIYEYAKEVGKQSKDLITVLKDANMKYLITCQC